MRVEFAQRLWFHRVRHSGNGIGVDESVIRSMAKWPDVPAVYGWLSLDRRGNWRLGDQRISHRQTIAFINRNYSVEDGGLWFFQNGPQRVYVALEYTPWVYALDADGSLRAHTGAAVSRIEEVFIDDSGNLLLHTPEGVGILDDRDLAGVSAFLALDSAGGRTDLERAVREVQQGGTSNLVFSWGGERIPVGHVARPAVPGRFGFVREPEES